MQGGWLVWFDREYAFLSTTDIVLSFLKLHCQKIKCCGIVILVQQEMLTHDVAAEEETVILTKEELWEKNFTW